MKMFGHYLLKASCKNTHSNALQAEDSRPIIACNNSPKQAFLRNIYSTMQRWAVKQLKGNFSARKWPWETRICFHLPRHCFFRIMMKYMVDSRSWDNVDQSDFRKTPIWWACKTLQTFRIVISKSGTQIQMKTDIHQLKIWYTGLEEVVGKANSWAMRIALSTLILTPQGTWPRYPSIEKQKGTLKHWQMFEEIFRRG